MSAARLYEPRLLRTKPASTDVLAYQTSGCGRGHASFLFLESPEHCCSPLQPIVRHPPGYLQIEAARQTIPSDGGNAKSS